MFLNVDDTQAPLIFRFAGSLPCYKAFSFSIYISFVPKAMLSVGIYLLDNSWWKLQGAHIKVGKAKKTEFTNISLPL